MAAKLIHTAARVKVTRKLKDDYISVELDTPDWVTTALELRAKIDECDEAIFGESKPDAELPGQIRKDKLPLNDKQKKVREADLHAELQKALETAVEWIPNSKGNGWHAKVEVLQPDFQAQFMALFEGGKRSVTIGDFTYSLFGDQIPMMGKFGKAKT